MNKETKGLVGRLYGVKVLPETQDEWLAFLDSELKSERLRIRKLIENCPGGKNWETEAIVALLAELDK